MTPVALLHRSVSRRGFALTHPSLLSIVTGGGLCQKSYLWLLELGAHWYPRTLAPSALNTDNKAVQTLESKFHVFKSSFFLWLSEGISRQSGVLEATKAELNIQGFWKGKCLHEKAQDRCPKCADRVHPSTGCALSLPSSARSLGTAAWGRGCGLTRNQRMAGFQSLEVKALPSDVISPPQTVWRDDVEKKLLEHYNVKNKMI